MENPYFLCESVNWTIETTLLRDIKASLRAFESQLKTFKENVLKQMNETHQQHQDDVVITKAKSNYENDIQFIRKKNKELKGNIESCLEKLKEEKTKVKEIKGDQKLLTQEVKETYEAFLTAKSFFKKRLKIYYNVTSKDENNDIVYIQFFTEHKRQNDMYSAKFLWHEKTKKCKLLDTTPRLSTYNEIKAKLEETNDVPGALCCIRQSFIRIKNRS